MRRHSSGQAKMIWLRSSLRYRGIPCLKNNRVELYSNGSLRSAVLAHSYTWNNHSFLQKSRVVFYPSGKVMTGILGNAKARPVPMQAGSLVRLDKQGRCVGSLLSGTRETWLFDVQGDPLPCQRNRSILRGDQDMWGCRLRKDHVLLPHSIPLQQGAMTWFYASGRLRSSRLRRPFSFGGTVLGADRAFLLKDQSPPRLIPSPPKHRSQTTTKPLQAPSSTPPQPSSANRTTAPPPTPSHRLPSTQPNRTPQGSTPSKRITKPPQQVPKKLPTTHPTSQAIPRRAAR